MASLLSLFGSDRDPREKLVKRFVSKTAFETAEELDVLLDMFHRLAAPSKPNGPAVIDWAHFVRAFGLASGDFPADPVTDRTRFLTRLFALFTPSRGDRVVELEPFVSRMATLRKGTPEQRAKLLFRVYAASDGECLTRDSFRLVSLSLSETARHISQQSLLAALERQKSGGMFGAQQRLQADLRLSCSPHFTPGPVERFVEEWHSAQTGDPSSFAKSAYSSYSAVPQFALQPKARDLYEQLPSGNEALLADQLFSEVFKKDRVKEKQFVDWAIEHPSVLAVLDFYSSLLASPIGLNRQLIVEKPSSTPVVASSSSTPISTSTSASSSSTTTGFSNLIPSTSSS